MVLFEIFLFYLKIERAFFITFSIIVENWNNDNVWFLFLIWMRTLLSFKYFILFEVFLEFSSPLPKCLDSIGSLFERPFFVRMQYNDMP